MFSSCRPGKTQENRKESISKGRARILKNKKKQQKNKGRKQTAFPNTDESDRPKGNEIKRNKKKI